MPNPMMAALFGNRIGGIKNMMSAVRSAGNPEMMLQQMAGNNPMVKQALDLVQQNGGDAKAAFMNLAKQNGVDPDTILNMLK